MRFVFTRTISYDGEMFNPLQIKLPPHLKRLFVKVTTTPWEGPNGRQQTSSPVFGRHLEQH